MLFLVVPTANTRPQLLQDLARDSGVPPSRIILVTTKPDLEMPFGVTVSDLGPPNIQRWWNRGIAEAERRGATLVAVANDDVRIHESTLPRMQRELGATGATIATPGRSEHRLGLHTRPLVPYSPRIWGSLWMLDLQSSLRPDPRYVWWYGDVDLDIRARRNFTGVVNVEVEWEHVLAGEGSKGNDYLEEQKTLDAQTFARDHWRLVQLSRLMRALNPSKSTLRWSV